MLCSIILGILAIAKCQSNINFWVFGDRQKLIFGVFTIANWVKCDRQMAPIS
ncbi:MAG: hypothetical protein QNJ41_08160 [Xenococcaceae cyanobacterium MO_188.B32]|nr:hypothetical protein [Xenococcaceae cyanobacterium MO_188.B32]